MEKRNNSFVRAVCRIGLMAAAIECAKLVLASLPNIEVVTLFIAVFSFVFGWEGLVATVIFVAIEPLIWGFGTWLISYLIYWPLVAVVFWLLGRLTFRRVLVKAAVATALAVLLTVFFGVLTSLVDIGLFSGRFDNFFARFAVYYARGAVFYLLQIGTNAVVFPILFHSMTTKLYKLK
ncbi:MAG: hypothetical protein IJF05_05880 [Clostridia bacterium]|nr:hypothetical protein [Clostridia bacterium]